VQSHVIFTSAEVSKISSRQPVDITAKSELMTDAAVRKKDIKHLQGRDLQTASAWLLG
jgi:hypothetical protein